MVTGTPGQTVASAMTSRAGRLGAGSNRPSHAGRNTREVDRQARFPGRAAVGVVLGREPVEGAAELSELPLDVDLAGVRVPGFQADRLAPAQAGVGDRDDHGEVLATAREERGPLCDE